MTSVPPQTMMWTGDTAPPSLLPVLRDVVKVLRPSTVVELGAGRDGAFLELCKEVLASVPSARCHGVDSWNPRDAGRGPGTDYAAFSRLQQRCLDLAPGAIFLVRSDFRQAAAFFDGRSIDFLYINGAPSEDGFDGQMLGLWKEKVRDGGVIVTSASFPLWEAVSSPGSGHAAGQLAGLGVAVNGSHPELEAWLAAASRAGRDEVYGLLGEKAGLKHAVALAEEKAAALEQQVRQLQVVAADFQHIIAQSAGLRGERNELRLEIERMKTEHGVLRRAVAAAERKLEARTKKYADLKEEAARWRGMFKKASRAVEEWNRKSWLVRAFRRLRLKREP